MGAHQPRRSRVVLHPLARDPVRRLGGPANARYATRNPADPDKLVAVGADGAARSKDAGSTWQDVDVPPGTSKVQYAADGRTLYAATAIDNQPARLYRSGDDGANWQPSA